MGKRNDLAVVVWAPEENRSEQIAERFGAPCYQIHYFAYKRPLIAPIKYVPQAIKTLVVLWRQRPRVVYVTNPPVFAALVVALYARLSGAQFIMDTHSPALFARKWRWSVPLQRMAARWALVNVVDQPRYRRLFESWGAPALVLEKPLAECDGRDSAGEPQPFRVTVINTFAADEPLEPVLEAARRLPDVCFTVLGDTALADARTLARAPDNVEFPGYLLGDDYWRQLARSHVVMALTTYPYSLLAGGHDGLSLGKPLILSAQPALTEFYDRGVVFVENDAQSLVEGVQRIRQDEARYRREIRELADEKRREWQASFERLRALVDEHCRG
ncbi:MAG TPA: hypothetical protein PKI52_08370 [Aggregatilineales bacterium]|nr:hypothetical protein [Aggregatilineales bacterium]